MPIRHAVILAVLCTIPGGSVAAQPVQSTCDLDKILEAVPKSSASTRTRLLVAALNETCADELDGGLQVWLTTWRGGTVNEADATLVEARRDQACPKGVDLWGAALNTDLPQTLSDFAKTCKLRKLGLTDHADGTAGPEAALLGSSVYQSLVDHGADADKARTIGAWISGARYPGEPRFSRGVYGEVAGHIQGVTLPVLAGHPQMQQRSCEPVIAIHPGQTQLNGVEVSSEELSAGSTVPCPRQSLQNTIDYSWWAWVSTTKF